MRKVKLIKLTTSFLLSLWLTLKISFSSFRKTLSKKTQRKKMIKRKRRTSKIETWSSLRAASLRVQKFNQFSKIKRRSRRKDKASKASSKQMSSFSNKLLKRLNALMTIKRVTQEWCLLYKKPFNPNQILFRLLSTNATLPRSFSKSSTSLPRKRREIKILFTMQRKQERRRVI